MSINIFKAFYHGLCDGFSGENKHGYLYGRGLPPPIEPTERDNTVDDEIALLEVIIERRKLAASILERELDDTHDTKKKAIILNKLNALDKQTFKDVQRLNKLLDMD